MNQNIPHAQRGLGKLGISTIFAVSAALVLGGVVYAQKHHRPTGKDAFLHYQVDSTDELVQALQSNPQLREHYAKHFGIPESRVVDFVKNALVPYRLPEAREVTVYGVTKSGFIYPVHERLRKGTRVWATRSGVPVLKWACANPLMKTMPGTLLANAPKGAHPKVVSRHRIAMPVALKPVAAPPVSVATATTLAAPPINTTALAAPILPPAVGAAAAPVPALAITPVGSSHNSISPFLIPLGLVLGTIASHNGSTPGGGGNELPPPVAIPEPGTFALFATAALPLLGMANARRRRSVKA